MIFKEVIFAKQFQGIIHFSKVSPNSFSNHYLFKCSFVSSLLHSSPLCIDWLGHHLPTSWKPDLLFKILKAQVFLNTCTTFHLPEARFRHVTQF